MKYVAHNDGTWVTPVRAAEALQVSEGSVHSAMAHGEVQCAMVWSDRAGGTWLAKVKMN